MGDYPDAWSPHHRREAKDEERRQFVEDALVWLGISREEHQAAAGHEFFAPVLQLAYARQCSFWDAQYAYVSALVSRDGDGQVTVANPGMSFEEAGLLWRTMKSDAGIG